MTDTIEIFKKALGQADNGRIGIWEGPLDMSALSEPPSHLGAAVIAAPAVRAALSGVGRALGRGGSWAIEAVKKHPILATLLGLTGAYIGGKKISQWLGGDSAPPKTVEEKDPLLEQLMRDLTPFIKKASERSVDYEIRNRGADYWTDKEMMARLNAWRREAEPALQRELLKQLASVKKGEKLSDAEYQSLLETLGEQDYWNEQAERYFGRNR